MHGKKYNKKRQADATHRTAALSVNGRPLLAPSGTCLCVLDLSEMPLFTQAPNLQATSEKKPMAVLKDTLLR
jgi:hypothetical protein